MTAGRPATKPMNDFMRHAMQMLGCASLSELSRKTGITQSTLYGYAHEGRLPRANDRRLSDALGISFGDLVNGLLDIKAS